MTLRVPLNKTPPVQADSTQEKSLSIAAVMFFPFKVILLLLDFLVTLITFGWIGIIKKLLAGDEMPMRSEPVNGDETHRVKTGYNGNLLKTPVPGCETLYDISERSFRVFAEKKCMGKREFLGWKSPKVKEFGETIWKTYKEVGNISHKFGAALAACGMIAAPDTTTLEKVSIPCRLAIFENTCPEWMMAAQGAFTQSITVTTIYATLGLDAVVDAVNDNVIPVIVCNAVNVSKLVERLPQMPTLKTIIYTHDIVAPGDVVDIPTLPEGVRVVSFEDFWASGDPVKYPVVRPKADTAAVIMYTSGSTGKPKGVVITHRAILAACAAGLDAFTCQDDDAYMAYLPLAHIMELMAEFVFISGGSTLCYADPKTLSNRGAYPTGSLEHFKPTILVAVPKIWDTIKKGIEAKVAEGSVIVKLLVETAFQAREFAVRHGYDTPLFNALVFKKFRNGVGGRLRLALSGGGPLNGEVQDFLRVAFAFELGQGYGLTETCAATTIQGVGDPRVYIAGSPVASVEVKLESTPDIFDKAGMPYLTSDTHDVDGESIYGRGEILCRGDSVSSGYYMMPEVTKEVFGADGWFHTGDIGQFMTDGSLRIVDRKKNLVKLKGGEYIALEQMEMAYGNSSWVDAVQGGICCYGDGEMDRPIALLQLKQEMALAWASANGVKGDIGDMKNDPALYHTIMEDLKKEHAKSNLSHLEKLAAIVLLDSPWTPENGCLTAANKLQRKAVIELFSKEFGEARQKGIF